MKGILSHEHIKHVERESANFIYRIILTSFGSDNPLSILKVSPKGLIFVRGTDDTGWNHIHKRHSGISANSFWTEFKDHKGEILEKTDSFGRKKLRLDNPSLFHPHSIPVYDYVTIADKVYERANLNNEANNLPDLFDLYDGVASGIEGIDIRYRLLTYKNSRIVHTLFPLVKDFSPRKPIVHYSRQSASSTVSIPSGQVQIEIPYHDEYDVVRFIIIIRNNIQEIGVEHWFIQLNSPSGIPIVTKHFMNRLNDCVMDGSEFLMRLDNTDLSPLEEEMKRMEKSVVIIKN